MKAEAKIFEGCKHPELIDEYIRGVKAGAKESQLQALKEGATKITAEQILEKLEFNVIEREVGSHDLSVHMSYEMLEEFKEEVLNLITNLEDNG